MTNDNKEVMNVEAQPVVVVDNSAPYSLAEVKNQVNLIQHIMRDVMQSGQHYGLVPGCGNKPSLFKSGAEKLSFTFKLRPIIGDKDIVITPMPNDHREYAVHCHIYNMNGIELATGIGSASTMEKKFRYRKNFKTNQQEENPCIADVYNTVLKMAKKRAYVDGMLSATAASDIFTQDIEDMERPVVMEKPVSIPKPQVDDIKAEQEAKEKAEIAAKVAEAKAKLAKAGIEATKVEKVEPKPATQAPKQSESGLKCVRGEIVNLYPPKSPKGPTNVKVMGSSEYYSTFDKPTAELLEKYKADGSTVEIQYEVKVNGKYSNNLIKIVNLVDTVMPKPMTEEPPLDDIPF